MPYLPQVTIITVVKNRVDTMHRCLKSISEQKYPNLQHVIVDGGSDDGTYELCKKNVSSNTLIISEPDDGIYCALNKGIALATGEIVGVLHSDDVFADENAVSEVVSFMIEQQAQVVFGDSTYCMFAPSFKKLREYSSANFNSRLLSFGFMPSHTAMFVHYNIFKTLGTYNSAFKLAGDFEFVIRLFRSQDFLISFIPKNIVFMATGGASNKNIKNRYLLNVEIIEACRMHGIRTSWIRMVLRNLYKLLFTQSWFNSVFRKQV